MALSDSKPKNEIETKIIDTLEKIRPFLQRDGGDIAFDHYDDETGTVFIKVVGACMGCLYIGPEITEGVTTIVQDEVPEVNTVQIVEPTQEEMKEYGITQFPPNPFGGFPENEMIDPVVVDEEKKDDKDKSDK